MASGTAEGIIRLLQRAGFQETVEEDSIAYLSQLNPQLADVLQFMNEYKFSAQNFLYDSEVELYIMLINTRHAGLLFKLIYASS